MVRIDNDITLSELSRDFANFWAVSGQKIRSVQDYDLRGGAPVFTVAGRYQARGWTDWTLGFFYGSALLQFDATNDETYLRFAQQGIRQHMEAHLTHVGVHDHGFTTISTYGNLLRLMNEGRLPESDGERAYYELAIKVSGAMQANRWMALPNERGYIYSFNGPHSLFIDTIRTLRVLVVAHQLGHYLASENDRPVNLLHRVMQHLQTTATYAMRWRAGTLQSIAHESLFNPKDGNYRCPSTQQGYSPYTTWTRGMSWAILGFAEQLDFFNALHPQAFGSEVDKLNFIQLLEQNTREACNHFLDQTPADGIAYWDTGAPGLAHWADHRNQPADPFNAYEPVDSSASAIAAQGFCRFGTYLIQNGQKTEGDHYLNAGLTITKRLLSPTYLSLDPDHEGLLLHVIYHQPNGWDYVPPGSTIPFGESAQWGDYHLRELVLYLSRLAREQPPYSFYLPNKHRITS
jgi:unsaturated chondroitin disaccharide hydrolase